MPSRSLLVAAGLSVAALAACSSPPSTGAVDTAFVTKITTACQEVLVAMANTPFPYPSGAWNPNDPAVNELVPVGRYEKSLSINHTEVGFLQRLGKPKRGTGTWNAFISLVGQEQTLVTAQINAALASDKAGFLRTSAQIKTLSSQIDTQAAAVGLPKGSYCIELFG